MKIIADIGGTYVRLAQVKDGLAHTIKKYNARDFDGLKDVLENYCKEHNLDNKGIISIAAAGADMDGQWVITNNPDWSLALTNSDWNIQSTLNDFEAATYSLPALTPDERITLKESHSNNKTLCLIGVGTGLGLGYYRDGVVQKTHGGHIPIASLNDKHGKAIKAIRATLDRDTVFEDIVSGPGFQKLRRIYGEDKALILFHEFLGIFAATAAINGHAFDGLYLTGGVIQSLMDDDKFNVDLFTRSICFDCVPCVKQDLTAMPIYFITDPYPALKGLIHAQSLSDH
ncbi:MAG: glucokinase [Bdellovibrionales bacterium]